MSLARRHYERTVAAKQAAAMPLRQAVAVPASGSLHDRMLAQLGIHKAALKAIQSRKGKAEAKLGFLQDYEAYVEGVLAAGNGAQDTVLVTVMMWRIDAGLYAQALEIAAYALRHEMAMPDGWARDLPTSLLEELAEQALTDPENQDLAVALGDALDLTEGKDMPDEVRAKALKALGMMVKDSDVERAIGLLEEACTLDPRCGVKTELKRLKKVTDNDSADTEPGD
ncbi:phage terminase small subunit [Telmatospirillum sp. J64-1]|uniref:phage terminase small subunit n=1 Tax=Telmatospirillum sp. J64-1 TaxID=2502183 RepID=UPI00115C5937|nr:phage terminase small subunit [Telmatospirillum sp. J64-1]